MRRTVLILILAVAPALGSAQEPPAPAPPTSPASAAPSAPKPTKGYVLQVEGKLVYLDLGLRDNVRTGDTFEIIRDQDIVHPITGESLGGKVTVGVVRVIQVFEKLSVAEIASVIPGATIDRLDRIRMGNEPLEPPPPPAPEPAAPAPPPPPPAPEAPRNPDGTIGGIDLGVAGGYEKQRKTRWMGADLMFPLAGWLTLGGEIGDGRESHTLPTGKETMTDREMGGMARLYMGRWLRKGEDINPDGAVGSVILELGGGVRRAKTTLEQPIILAIDTTKAPPDTSRGTRITSATIRRNGYRFGVLLPMARKWTFGAGYDWGKEESRVRGLLRYFKGEIEPGWEGANPDGRIGSPVLTLFGSYDSKGITSRKWMGMDMTLPLSRLLTFGLTYETNRKMHVVQGGLRIHVEKRLLR